MDLKEMGLTPAPQQGPLARNAKQISMNATKLVKRPELLAKKR